MPNYIVLPSLLCMGIRSNLSWVWGGGMGKTHFRGRQWQGRFCKTSSWNYKLHIVYSPFLIRFVLQNELFFDLRELKEKPQFLGMLTSSSTYLEDLV